MYQFYFVILWKRYPCFWNKIPVTGRFGPDVSKEYNAFKFKDLLVKEERQGRAEISVMVSFIGMAS